MSKNLNNNKNKITQYFQRKQTNNLDSTPQQNLKKKLKKNNDDDESEQYLNKIQSDPDTEPLEEQSEDESPSKNEHTNSINKETDQQNKKQQNEQYQKGEKHTQQSVKTKDNVNNSSLLIHLSYKYIHNISKEQNDINKSNKLEKQMSLQSQTSKMKNLQFYLNKFQSTPNGDYIENMLLKWRGNFKLLEVHHGYVQWLFPNFYQSRFNGVSDALLKEEAEEFINNPEIAKRLKRSYELIYEFFGMKITNDQTGYVERAENYKERSQDTFIVNPHNLMRVRRILCHYNNVGFRRYSISLVKFLEKEIYGEKGYQNFADDKRPLVIKWQELPQIGPLRNLARQKVFEEWRIYGEIDESNPIEVKKLEDNCFASLDDIKRESIYFSAFQK